MTKEGIAGPLMVRHNIDGHDVLLPYDAVLHPRIKASQECLWPECRIVVDGFAGCEHSCPLDECALTAAKG